MIGMMVGQYRITGAVGQGGMGTVYAAEHALIGRVAAVKVLLPELSRNQDVVTRFFNEARAATAIRHPGIVEIYDFGYHNDGSAYIVMELLQGEPLAARMARGRLGSQGALAVVRQIAGALAAAHNKGIVHRDLKPDNVFLVPDPEVPGGERIKLLDFGIAKLAGDAPASQKTRTGAVMGTPTYMAPEQCRGVAVDKRADLYSLGCILFELCTGRPPFVGEGVGDVLAAHIHVPPPSVTSIVSDAPHELDVLVQRLLVKDPAQRIQSAEEIIHAVDLATGGAAYRTGPRVGNPGYPMPTSPAIPPPTTLSGAAHAYQTGPGTGHSLPPPRSRTGLVVGVGAAAAVIAILVIVMLAVGGGGGDETNAPLTPAAILTEPDVKPVTPPAPSPPVPLPVPAETPPPPPPPVPVAVETPPPAAAEIMVDSIPAGADILRDGTLLGKTPFVMSLPTGAAAPQLTLRLKGYKDSVVTAEGKVQVKLEKKKRTAKPKDDRDQSVNPFGY